MNWRLNQYLLYALAWGAGVSVLHMPYGPGVLVIEIWIGSYQTWISRKAPGALRLAMGPWGHAVAWAIYTAEAIALGSATYVLTGLLIHHFSS